jgi:hypothetical protein
METWKQVVGFEGLYEVSDLGRVRSSDRMSKSKLGSYRKQSGKLILGGTNSRGYRLCLLYPAEGKRKTVYFHHLVLKTFVGDPLPSQEACHNDGNKQNNRLDNLRWDTHVKNCGDREKHGTNHKGSLNGNSKLTEKDVLMIRYDTRRYIDIAKQYEISQSLVSMIKTRKWWKHI